MNIVTKNALKFGSIACMSLLLLSCTSNTETESQVSEGVKTDENITASGSYSLNSDESHLSWTGHMLKVGGVSLYNHRGTLVVEKGRVTMEDGKINDGTIVVDMTTITPTDNNFTPEEGRTPEKLIGHLSSPDFFAVDSFPTATLEINGMNDGTVQGEMTVRGITKPVDIKGITMDTDGDMLRTKGTMTLNRQDFGAAFSMPVQDKVLSNDIDLEFNFVFDVDKESTM